MMIPVFWMLSSAVKPNSKIFIFPPQWIPDPIQWDNFTKALTTLPFATYFQNTMIIEVGTIVGTVLSCSIVAYGFARLDAPGRNFWFVVLLSTMMLPGVVTMIPVYLIFRQFGWVNTFLPLIVPNWFGSAFFIFLLRQFFMTIPRDFEEAARIDGANTWQILTRIVLPSLQACPCNRHHFHLHGRLERLHGAADLSRTSPKRTRLLWAELLQGAIYLQLEYADGRFPGDDVALWSSSSS